MRWLLIVLLTAVPAMAEEVTTANVTPDMSAFTASGSTQTGSGCSAGQFCTGNASNGGGTYTSTFDIPLTEDEIQRGFTVNQFVDVNSHSSNATLATCVSTTQAGDCRDIFSMTVALFDITNIVVEKWEREIELDFSGTRTFTFADEVSPNSFSLLTGEFELWGIDAGFHSGAFGPQFSAPGVSFTYQDVVEQQVLEQIAQLDTQIAFIPPPTEIAAAPPPPPATAQPAQTVATAYAEPAAPAPPPVVAQIQTTQPEPEQQQQEAEVEAAIEMEMQTQTEPEQPEPQTEQQAEAEPEPDAEPEPEQQAESEPEPRETAEAEPEPEPEPEQQQAEAEPETKQEKQKAAAERVVKKIAPSQRYSAASQATTMVVMNMLAGKIATDVTMIDTQGFFPATGMNDDRSMSNPLQDYTMFGGSNAAHDRFMQLEWNR